MASARVPEYAEHPDYGIYPCSNAFHATNDPRPLGFLREGERRCPDCGNTWWATDGTACPEDYALIAEIDALRARTAELLCALRAYAHGGSEPAVTVMRGETCCGEWPECSHTLAMVGEVDDARH